MKPKYFYHLTDNNWGESIILHPRSSGYKRDYYEPDTSRICVSSTISGCFVAIYIHEMSKYNIYRTKRKVIGTKPTGIPDYKITNEFWLTDSTEFILYKNIKKDTVKFAIDSCEEMINSGGYLGDGKKYSETWQRKTKKQISNILGKIND